MSLKAPKVPEESPEQIKCREWWTKRLGHAYVGWGRNAEGKYLTEFCRNVYDAWLAAKEAP